MFCPKYISASIFLILINISYCRATQSGIGTKLLNAVIDGQEMITQIPREEGDENAPPVTVKTSILIRSIASIDDVNMDFSLDVTLWLEWFDPRLKFNYSQPVTLLGMTEFGRIWTPDMYFTNEKNTQLHNFLKPNMYVRVYPNGTVLLSTHATTTLVCPMNLRFFPLDMQMCQLRIGSYSYVQERIRIKWGNVPVILQNTLELPKFKLNDFKMEEHCGGNWSYASGTYPCIRVKFEFYRQIGYYLNNIYIPTGMIVLISWVSFWIGIDVLEARLSLGITSLLTLATQIFGISQSVPVVSYTKALDVWTAACLIYVNMSILQVSALLVLRKRNENFIADSADCVEMENGFTKLKILDNKKIMRRIDQMARILFPTSFLLFNIFYWGTLVIADQECFDNYENQQRI